MSGWYQWQGDTLILNVRVQPKASCDEIVGPQNDDSLKIRITAPPLDGKANVHLIKYLAKAFGVPKSRITLLKGETGRNKRLAINAPSRFPAAAEVASGSGA